jgi:hypothetical protein
MTLPESAGKITFRELQLAVTGRREARGTKSEKTGTAGRRRTPPTMAIPPTAKNQVVPDVA